MKDKLNKHCKGCSTYNKRSNKCGDHILTKINLSRECPCSHCLVKSMCKEACREYHVFVYEGNSDDK